MIINFEIKYLNYIHIHINNTTIFVCFMPKWSGWIWLKNEIKICKKYDLFDEKNV